MKKIIIPIIIAVVLLIAAAVTFFVFFNKNNEVEMTLIPVKSSEKWGCINKKGEYIINPQFADVSFFRNGLAKIVTQEGKVGYIDAKGKYAIPAKYKKGTHFQDDLAFVVLDGGRPTCIDKSGKTQFELKQAKIVFQFSEGLAMFINSEDKYGFVDKSGKVVINPQFENAMPFKDGFAAFNQKGKWGFIDKTGKIVINPQFDYVDNFYEGKAVFNNGKDYGYVDTKGNYVINPQFKEAGRFSDGMAVIRQGNTFGFIDEKGKIEINPQFDDAENFKRDLALVRQGEMSGFVDKKGKFVINPQFDRASSFFGEFAFVESGDKWGIVDKKGKYIVNPQFDYIKTVVEDYSYVQTDFYDASEFISIFFKKAETNSFDGFTANSTLQNIVDNEIYGDNLNANDKNMAICKINQETTKDISLSEISFFFANPIYENVTNYENYYGYTYPSGTKKNYKFSEKIAFVAYEFNLSGDARDKDGAIANAMKTEIEKRYNVKMESKDGQYFVMKDNNLSFAVIYQNYSLLLCIGFDKNYLQNILNKINNKEDYEEEAVEYVD